jgi:hypothetical protein
LSDWAIEAAQNDIEDFQAKRIRSGVETLLASAGVSQDIRGRLQSHGIGGVQTRHYDGHDYLSEKRTALEILFRVVDQRTAATAVGLKSLARRRLASGARK